jgi:hypothetical protein
MTSDSCAQRLVDEFEQAASFYGGFSVRHGIAAVLRHLIDSNAQYGDVAAMLAESFYAVPTNALEDLADVLEAPTLMERALAGDTTAAKQFLHEAGFTDKHGQWLPQYQPIPETTND